MLCITKQFNGINLKLIFYSSNEYDSQNNNLYIYFITESVNYIY